MSFLAYILVAEGKPLTFYTEDIPDALGIPYTSHYLSLVGGDRVWMIETETEARGAIAANRITPRGVHWYNASYYTPQIAPSLLSQVKVAKAEVEFKIEFSPMPTLSCNIVGYEIVEEGGDE